MKYFKNKTLVLGLTITLAGLAAIGIGAYCFHTSPTELTHAELEKQIAAGTILDGRVTPTPYPGIYHVEGSLRQGQKLQSFEVTTHLEEFQVKALLAAKSSKIEMPGAGLKGQW